MFDLDKWQEIFNTIQKHKLRTFLTALGVFWGIFMLVFLMGAGKGLENGVMSMMGGRATNTLYVWTQRTTVPYMGLSPGRRAQLRLSDIEAIETHFSADIQYIAPRLFVPSGEIVNGDNKGAFEVRGERPDFLNIEPYSIIKGRFINDLDLKQRRKVVAIGKRVAEVLFEEEVEPIGNSIKINGTNYLVVGIFKSKRTGGDSSEDEQNIFMPLTTAQQVTNRPNDINWFVCSMYPSVSAANVEKPLKNLLRKRHKISPDDDQGVRSFNLEEEFREFEGLFFGIKLIVWIVGIGSLLAGVIGVGNIMLIIVKERTKEIGIRKALGATPSSIVSMILLESVFITTIAGYLGLLTATGIIAGMSFAVGEGNEFFANPEVDFVVGFGALVILVISGALTGLVPALNAANINPVIALKDE